MNCFRVAFAALLFVFSLQAQAASVAHCWDGDCLTKGWTIQDLQSHVFQMDVQCLRGSCLENGWITGDLGGSGVYTQCRQGGCFQEGWFENYRYQTTPHAQVLCNEDKALGRRNCFTAGWTQYGNGYTSVTRCTQNDCTKYGWTTIESGRSRSAICMKEACFKVGYILNQ